MRISVCTRGDTQRPRSDRRRHGVSAPCYAWAMTYRQSRNEVSEHEGSFGARLRGLRKDAGLTQQELAQRAGLSLNAVNALERGVRKHPYPHTVRSLADALGLSEEGRTSLLAAVPDGGKPASAVATPASVVEASLPSPPTP